MTPEGGTASSEKNAEAEAADEEIATGDGVAAETPISDNPEINLVKGGVFIPVYSDEGELLGYAEMEYPECLEVQDTPEDKVPDNLPEKPHNEEETDSEISEGIENSLDVSEDKVSCLKTQNRNKHCTPWMVRIAPRLKMAAMVRRNLVYQKE